MTNQSGRKRVKMKPPWRWSTAALSPTCSNYLNWHDRRRHRLRARQLRKAVISATLSALVALTFVIAIICDQRQLLVSCLRVEDDSDDGGGRGSEQQLNGELALKTTIGSELKQTNLEPKHVTGRQQTAGSLSSSSTLPYFNLSKMPRVVAASSYQSEVYLPCQIVNLDEDQTVSWIRKRDSLVVSVDKMRLVDDARFELNQAPDDWTLVLSQPNELDAGLYECQVSSMEPKLSHLVELRMLRAESSISNFSSLYVRPADLINLTCSIVAPQATSYVYWYKNKEVVQFDNLRAQQADSSRPVVAVAAPLQLTGSTTDYHPSLSAGKRQQRDASVAAGGSLRRNQDSRQPPVKLSRVAPPVQNRLASNSNNNNNNKLPNGREDQQQQQQDIQWSRSSSTLIIREAQLNDTANYTCLPANAKPSQIRVIVIENGLGSQPEKRSLQADSASTLIGSPGLTWLKVRVLLFNWSGITRNLAHYYGYSGQDCFKGQCITAYKVASTRAEYPIYTLIDILTDANAILWSLSILVAFHIIIW